MKKLLFIAVALVAMLLTGCSSGQYMTTSSNLNLTQTQVVLSEANFRVVKNVHTYLVYKQDLKFDADQLRQSAYASLLREANLQGAQCLINVTFEEVGRVAGGFFGVTKSQSAILVTGTVIEFTK